MESNENNAKIDQAILDLLRRGHPHRGKKMAIRLREDPPPDYGQPGEAPPYYDSKGKEPATKEKSSSSEELSTAEEASVAEKRAPVAAESAPVVPEEAPADDKYKKPADFKLDPLYFMRKRAAAAAAAEKTGPTEAQIGEAKIKKMMDSLSNMVKTEQEVEQGTKLSDYDIAQRADAHFIKKNLKLRYFHECSEEHFNEFKNLISKGMSVDEACAAHSDFHAWMFIESQLQGGRS